MSGLGETTVVVAINGMTGAWEEYCLYETPGYEEWRQEMASYGWTLTERTLDEVLAYLDSDDSAPPTS